ncbi:hypothetical protein FALCPG4_011030 [Fusarium falciforme]
MLQHLREMDAIILDPSLSSSTSVPGSTGARTDPHWGTDGDVGDSGRTSCPGSPFLTKDANICSAGPYRRAPMEGSLHTSSELSDWPLDLMDDERSGLGEPEMAFPLPSRAATIEQNSTANVEQNDASGSLVIRPCTVL